MSGINGGPIQNPANWRYSIAQGGISLATYPGNVQFDGIGFDNVSLFANVATIQATDIPLVVDCIQTIGYYSPGDGGGSNYIRAVGAGPGNVQSLDGQWWTLANQRYVDVKCFGVRGTNSGDDTAAFQDALDSGRGLFCQTGVYLFTAQLVSNAKSVAIQTAAGVEFKWLAASVSQGFNFTFTDIVSQSLTFGDCKIVTEREGGGTALKAVWPSGPTGYARLAEIGLLKVSGADIPGQVGYWDVGADLTNAWIAHGGLIDFYGKLSGITPLSTAAIIARGSTTDAFYPFRARAAKAGLLIAGFSELLDVSGSIAVACDYGVDCLGTSGLNTPGFNWIGGHASCFKGAVRSVNILQGNISDLLIYKRPDSTFDFIGIDLNAGSTEWQIENCKVFSFANPGGGTTTSIRDAGVNNVSKGMRNISCDTDLNIVGTASGFMHEFSRSDNARGSIIQGSVNGQVSVLPGGAPGSTINYVDTLAANSTTPTVLGHRKWTAGGGYLITANTIATLVANFLGGFPGDKITIQANDALTTLKHNANLLLNGGVNKVLALGETITLVKVSSTAWRQV